MAAYSPACGDMNFRATLQWTCVHKFFAEAEKERMINSSFTHRCCMPADHKLNCCRSANVCKKPCSPDLVDIQRSVQRRALVLGKHLPLIYRLSWGSPPYISNREQWNHSLQTTGRSGTTQRGRCCPTQAQAGRQPSTLSLTLAYWNIRSLCVLVEVAPSSPRKPLPWARITPWFAASSEYRQRSSIKLVRSPFPLCVSPLWATLSAIKTSNWCFLLKWTLHSWHLIRMTSSEHLWRVWRFYDLHFLS